MRTTSHFREVQPTKTWNFCLFFLLFAQTALPCANLLYETKLSGMPVSSSSRSKIMQLRAAMSRGGLTYEKMEERLRDAADFEQRNDYAVALMHLGRSKEAVDLLQKLEQEQPANYSVAANLGTAFELAGNNQEALRWIQEGIRRNAKSHDGTEWLHVKILEAKIAAEKDPNYFTNYSVLNLKTDQIDTKIKVGKEDFLPKDVTKAIQYQLTERLQFVKPPDPVVASLLFEYAALEAAVGTLETAVSLLRLSDQFGYSSHAVNSLVAKFERRIFWTGIAIVVLVAGTIIGFLVYSYKRGWFVLSSKDLAKPKIKT